MPGDRSAGSGANKYQSISEFLQSKQIDGSGSNNLVGGTGQTAGQNMYL